MTERNNLIFAILLLTLIWAIFVQKDRYKGKTAEEWFHVHESEAIKNKQLISRLSNYQFALEGANNNIEEANSMIEDAKYYAWESYDEMGDALDNLGTVDTVLEP